MNPICIIDDDDDLRETLASILEPYGCVHFSDGNAALNALRAGLRPRVILLDLMMPTLTGWDFRAVQLADPSLAQIPVVVMTARTSTAPPNAPPLGQVDVLRKPFSIADMLTLVKRYDAH